MSDGGPLRRALQRRLLPVRVRPEAATALLAEAGYEDLEIDYPFTTVASHPFTMEVLTQQLGDVGITVNSRCQDLTWIDQTFTQGDYEMSEIRDSANIMQYGCEGGRERSATPTRSASRSSRTSSRSSTPSWTRTNTSGRCLTWCTPSPIWAWVTVISAPEVPMLMRADLEGIQEVRINNGIDLGAAHWAE